MIIIGFMASTDSNCRCTNIGWVIGEYGVHEFLIGWIEVNDKLAPSRTITGV